MHEITKGNANAIGEQEIEGHGGMLAARVLEAHGIDTVFTLSGGHLFSFYDGCTKRGLRLVDVRHEQTAVFAAEAWAKVTRRPGVAALTAGPGVTNGISALTGAHFSGSPLLVLGGRAPAGRWGQGSLQELDHVPIVKSVCKHAATSTTTAAVAGDVDRALRAACTAHRGPAFLDLPLDVAFGSAKAPLPPPPGADELRNPDPDPQSLQSIGALLASSERPVLLAGGDVYWERAEDALRRLAEECELPVFVNGLGRGTLAADHRLAFSRCRSAAFRQADLVIVAGTPLDFRLGFGNFGEARVVHVVDRVERIASHARLTASAGGNLTTALDGIREAALRVGLADRGGWVERLQGLERAKRLEEIALLDSEQLPIHPARIYGELRRRLDRDAIVIGDGGDFVSYAGKYVDTFTPGCFLDPGPFGCLGTGPGYALGAKLARPDRQVVLLLGDGAAGFSLGDLDTLVRFGVAVVVVIGNNVCWGLEKHPMQQLFGYHVAAELSPVASYDQVMKALGGVGERVEDPAVLGSALDRALAHRGPVVVDVRTDPANQYPRSSVLA